MKIYIVTETLHMGTDGDYNSRDSVNIVTKDKEEALSEVARINALPYEDYNWYSGDMEEWEV